MQFLQLKISNILYYITNFASEKTIIGNGILDKKSPAIGIPAIDTTTAGKAIPSLWLLQVEKCRHVPIIGLIYLLQFLQAGKPK